MRLAICGNSQFAEQLRQILTNSGEEILFNIQEMTYDNPMTLGGGGCRTLSL